MQTLWIVAILAAIYIAFSLFQKRNMLNKKKIIDDQTFMAAKDFQLEFEVVVDMAVKKIEEKISRLESLIIEAQEKSDQLDAELKLVNDIMDEIKEGYGLNKEKRIKRKIRPLPKIVQKACDDTSAEEVHFKDKSIETEKKLLKNEKYHVALAMVQDGYDVLDIAKVTGLGKGEVMLLKELHSKK